MPTTTGTSVGGSTPAAASTMTACTGSAMATMGSGSGSLSTVGVKGSMPTDVIGSSRTSPAEASSPEPRMKPSIAATTATTVTTGTAIFHQARGRRPFDAGEPGAGPGGGAVGGGASGGSGSAATAGLDSRVSVGSCIAAPRAIEFLGWVSTLTGRPSSAPTSCATRGIRDDPPTSNTVVTSAASMSAASIAKRSAPTLSTSGGRIMISSSARVRRISVRVSGSITADGDVGVGRQGFLRQRAVGSQPGDGRHGRRVVLVEVFELAGQCSSDVTVDRSVEIDATEAFDPFWSTQYLEPQLCLAQHRGIERATTEVIDRHDRSGLDPFLAGVVDRGRLGLGQHVDIVEACQLHGLTQQFDFVRSPVGRVGDHHLVSGAALVAGYLVDDPPQQSPGQRLRRVRTAADEDGRRVTDATLELPSQALRFR